MKIDKTSYTSNNHVLRPKGTIIDAFVLHSGEGTKKSDLSTLMNDKIPEDDRVSAHYYIDRLGNCYQLVDPGLQAYHAGSSSYRGRTSWNRFSIGCETEHKKGQDWPVVQVQSIHDLIKVLLADGRFPFQEQYMVAHRWIAYPLGRKPDPTDWTNDQLEVFFSTFFVAGPVTPALYSFTGLTEDKKGGSGFRDLYALLGGFTTVGYALMNETPDIDILGRKCTYMRFERCIFKYVEGEGAHLSLLSEAMVKGWIT